MSKTINDIPPGESWATKFRTTTFCLDGVPVTATNLALGQPHPGEPTVYEGLGIIKTRDKDSELLELIDTQSQQQFTVNYADCWAWEPIEWIENE